jgi:hypothetical protein
MKEMLDFLDYIFDPKLLEGDEKVCFNITSGSPGLPTPTDSVNRALSGKRQRAAYFSTATMVLGEDGRPYNRDSLFRGLWVIVLDDIGTGEGAKCHRDDLPLGVWDQATYRIESSPENFQLGFVLDAPIRNLAHAKELVKLVYGAGPWDSGGALACKWVRLPAGYNTKDKYGEDGDRFAVKLETLEDAIFSPDELLKLVGAGVGWQDVLDGVSAKREPRNRRGAQVYQGGATLDMNGVVDPLAEWLHEKDMVLNVRYPWLDIKCPWAEDHTEDNPKSTGYSPVGWGFDQAGKQTRWFNCFHGHCEHNHTQEFIDWCIDMGGPRVAVNDPAAPLLARYIFSAGTNSWVDIMSDPMVNIPDAGFKNLHANSVWFPKASAAGTTWGHQTAYNLMKTSDSLVKVVTNSFDPGEGLVVGEGYERRLNTCRLPFYASGDANMKDVEMFRGFMKYLMPDDYEWFIRFMSMKAKNPKFRGPGVFMHTATQGTGRGTLSRIIRELWGESCVGEPTMGGLLRGIGGEAKNDELETLWVLVPEADDSSSDQPTFKHYEHLKKFLDPAPIEMTYDRKYGGRWTGQCYASTVICSNHYDGLRLDMTDRRVHRIANTRIRGDEQFFSELYDWIKGSDWQASVWQYLLAYDCGDWTGMAPEGATTEESRIMMLSTQSPIDQAVELAMAYCDRYTGGLFRSADIEASVSQCAGVLKLHNMRNWESGLNKELKRASDVLRDKNRAGYKLRVNGKVLSLRHTFKDVGLQSAEGVKRGAVPADSLRDQYSNFSVDKLSAYIVNQMEDLQ